MGEFRLPQRTFLTRRHDNWMVALVSIGAVVLALGILFFIGYGPHSVVHQVGPLLVWSILLIVFCAVGLDLFILRRTFDRVKYDLRFVLNQDELIRERPGFPDVRISLQKIRSLHEQSGCLVVTGGDPLKRIAVPQDVENFELLKAELLNCAPLSSPPRHSSLGWVTSSLFIISGMLLIWPGNVTIIRTAATVFVGLLGWESFKLHRLLQRGPKRWVFWLLMACVWLSTGFLIYIRVFGGRL